jgi:hypothetical protein
MSNKFVIKNGLVVNGGGLQMSGSLDITGSLSISNVVNAGTDTDKFLVLDSTGNVDFRTGNNVISDIGATPNNGGVITPIQLYADCKSLTSGNVPWNVLSDLQPTANQGYAVWIAPAAGHLYESDISPEQTNTSTSGVIADLIINGSTTAQKTITMGAAGNTVNTSWGIGTYSFTKGDRLSFNFDKDTNTSDLYAIQLTFRLDN